MDVPLPTSVNRIWRRSKWSTYISPEYVAWMERASAAIALQRGEALWPRIEGWFDCAMLLPESKRLIADIDNRTKAALDWAQKAGLIANDKLCNRHVLQWGPMKSTVRIWLVPVDMPLDLR